MNLAERQAEILRDVRRDGSASVSKLAVRLGVTPMTVRRDLAALAELGEISRVHGGAALPRIDLVEPPRPRALSTRRELTLAMLVPAATHHFIEVARGAQTAAQAIGARLEIAVSCYNPAEERAQIERLLQLRPNGLLLTPSRRLEQTPQLTTLIHQLPIPTIIVERRPHLTEAGTISHVASDHERGALTALQHLRELGHRRIALLSERTPTTLWLRQAFETAVEHLGLDPDVPCMLDHPQLTARHELDRFLTAILEAGVTAILAHPDETALALARCAQARGLRVPGDLSIVAHGDELAGLVSRPMTAVCPPRTQVGRTAVVQLARGLWQGDTDSAMLTLLTPSLRVRTSTGIARSR